MKTKIDLSNILEYSIESNPVNVNRNYISILKEFNVSRVSLGVQSFTESALKRSNRVEQNFSIVLEALELLNNGEIDINTDIISFLPGSDLNSDLYSLSYIISRFNKLNHMSLYDLSIDEGSVFHKNGINLPDDEEMELYENEIRKLLISNNFKRYEVSNYSRNSKDSLHNTAYWQYKNYIGLGPAAHSKIDSLRFENAASLDRYVNNSDYKMITTISEKEKVEESLLMGLRIKKGINKYFADEYFKENGNKDDFFRKINKFIDEGLLIYDNENICPVENGYNRLNQILIDLFMSIE